MIVNVARKNLKDKNFTPVLIGKPPMNFYQKIPYAIVAMIAFFFAKKKVKG